MPGQPKIRRTRADTQRFVDVLTAEMPKCEWLLGGSWARNAPVVGDLDVMVVKDPASFLEPRFEFPPSFSKHRGGKQIYQGDLTIAPALHEGPVESIHVDFWCVPPSARGAFTMFIIGPKDLNVAQRAWASRKGFKLTQLGLFDLIQTRACQVDDGTEEDIYRILEMPWLDHEARQAFAKAEPRQEILVWDAPSDSVAGQTYRVERRGDGPPTCRCRSYEFSAHPRHCKHTMRALEGKLGPPRLEQVRESVV